MYLYEDQGRHAAVRNAAVDRLAEQYGLHVLDLYTPSIKIAEKLTDGVHFTPDGYEILAAKVVSFVRSVND